jgi:hypothetical protein
MLHCRAESNDQATSRVLASWATYLPGICISSLLKGTPLAGEAAGLAQVTHNFS